MVAVAAGAAVLTVVLTNGGGKDTKTEAAPQVALQPVAASGPDPFTGSVAVVSMSESATASGAASASGSATGRTVTGSDPGLYGGSRETASCDVPKLSAFLTSDQAKGRAWAGVLGIDPSTIDAYLRSLTPVVLRSDTRVTNHGFANGVATPYQSVLQSGTAVLIDGRGLPRVRCACGNPLLPPAALVKPPAYSGTPWPAFKPQDTVVVSPAPSPLKDVTVVDPSSGQSFSHGVGSPSASTSPSGSGSGSPSGSGKSSGSGSPSGSGSASPGSKSPGSPSSSPSGRSGSSSVGQQQSGAPSGSGSALRSKAASPSGGASQVQSPAQSQGQQSQGQQQSPAQSQVRSPVQSPAAGQS
ncbi:DUF6777 domain-containing protein [Kitasatospora sp. NPDC051853]|uniref:DUF6777 domain-containing protein n=1 Tax=Kitasatospora sp. NPDC051853 TaxID=3364058 RepID=UPI0037B7B737